MQIDNLPCKTSGQEAAHIAIGLYDDCTTIALQVSVDKTHEAINLILTPDEARCLQAILWQAIEGRI